MTELKIAHSKYNLNRHFVIFSIYQILEEIFLGTPSRMFWYSIRNICANFHDFIRSVPKISLTAWTIRAIETHT